MDDVKTGRPDHGCIHYSSATDISSIVDDFKRRLGINRIIAFSGGADSGLGEDVPAEISAFKEKLMVEEIRKAVVFLSGYNVAILTGGTSDGVPAAAARSAKDVGLATIGVFPRIGERKALSGDLLDLRICVEPRFGESCWGDESAIFAKLLDAAIVYGGTAGTLIEAAHILKINDYRMKRSMPVKFIVSITGSGGTADLLPYFPAKVSVRTACMPTTAITSARVAAKEILQRFNLEDDVKESGEER